MPNSTDWRDSENRLHRLDGPAVIWKNKYPKEEYWEHGKKVATAVAKARIETRLDFKKRIERGYWISQAQYNKLRIDVDNSVTNLFRTLN